MSEVLTYMPEPVVFTDSAAAKVYELIAEEGNDNLKLRVFITGGGCSGFQYGFTFDETINPDDTIVEKIISLTEDKKAQDSDEEDSDDGSSTGKTTPALKKSNLSVNKTEEDESGSVKATTLPDKQHTVQLLIDPMSLQYLLGAEIDYTEGLEGAQFVIRNPQAKTTCGCGSSFSI